MSPPDPELAGYTPDLSFVLEVGASETRTDAWEIRNVGATGSTLTYDLSKVHVSPPGENCNWLSFSPASGSLTRSGSGFPSDEIDFTANATDLTPGTTYTCTVNVTSNDPVNPGPFSSTITLTVDPPPGPDWDITDANFIELPPFEPGQYPKFSVTVKNIGNQPAPASKLKAESEDRDTGNDYYEALVDVPALAVNESITLQVPVRVGAFTEILVPKFTANAENLPERDPANNESGILLAVTRVEKSRIQGNTEKKTGFSGDPVNTATGNFVHHSTDLAIPARIADFRFTRFYNSQSDEVGPLGRGWRHSFMYFMDLSDATKPGMIYPDGHSEYWTESGGSYDPLFPQIFTRLEKVGANWRATMKDHMVINFDSTGRCTSYSDKNGNTVSLSYSGSNLASVTDPAGRVLSFTYSGSKLTRVQDWTGRNVEFGYTGDNLTSVTDTKNQGIALRYDVENRLDRITDQRGVHVLTLIYDALGRVTSQTDGRGNPTNFAYDTPVAFSTTITNAEGDTTVHVHNGAFQLLQVVDELGHAVTYTYDAATGLRDRITDKAGNPPTTFSYDSRGNLLQTAFPDTTTESFTYNPDDLPLTKTDQIGEVTTWTYDGDGNALTETDARGNAQTWTYNGFGQKLTETDRTGAVTTYTYDALGRLTRLEDADGVGESYGYDALWRQTTVSDDRGNTTTTVYNADDTIAQVQRPIGTVAYTYDQVGNRLTEQDARGNTTTFEYDSNSNRTEVILPNSLGTTTYAYDSLNRLSTTTDGRGKVWTRTYYGDSRLHKEIDPLGNETVYTYDANGNILTETDGSGRSTNYTYDAVDRRLTTTDGEGTTTTYGYDNRGFRTSVIDPRGNETVYTYDDLSRLSTVRVKASNPADDAVTIYVYDNEGRLKTVTDAEGSVWENQYSSAGQRTKRIDGLSRETTFAYDAAGNLEQITYPTAETESYTYDQNNRRVGLSYSDGRSATYTLDANGNTTQLSDWTGTTNYSYDEGDRVTSVTDPFGKVVQYGYDLAGNRTSITYPTVGAVTYTYDDRNGLSRVTDWNADEVNYTRDGALRLLTRIFPNGVEADYSYDNAGRLTSLSYEKGVTTLLSYALTLDDNSNPTSLTTAGLPTIDALYTKNLSYTHDPAHQMVSSSESDYSYDQRGALSHREQPGELESSFDFSGDGMLKSYSSLDGTSVENLFDANRIRIRATRDGAETRFVLDRQRGMANVIAETSASGTSNRYFLHGEQTLAMYDAAGNASRYYLTDPFGNVAALADSGGALTDTYRYDPFGNVIGQSGSTDNPFTFVGAFGVMAEPGGLYFMRARYYEPEQGRFISHDPVEGEATNPATLHRYIYGLNNSLVYTDPNGEFAITGAIALAHAKAFGLGFASGAAQSLVENVAVGAVSSVLQSAGASNDQIEMFEGFVDTSMTSFSGTKTFIFAKTLTLGAAGFAGDVAGSEFVDLFFEDREALDPVNDDPFTPGYQWNEGTHVPDYAQKPPVSISRQNEITVSPTRTVQPNTRIDTTRRTTQREINAKR